MPFKRSTAGIVLEQILHDWKHRHLLCWAGWGADSGELWGAYDCACCITFVGGERPEILEDCGCLCHARIDSLAANPEFRMFLLALKSSPEMPFVPKDYADMMRHHRALKLEHDKWRSEGVPGAHPEAPQECCEACKLVLQQEARHAEHQKDPQLCGRKTCFICDECQQSTVSS